MINWPGVSFLTLMGIPDRRLEWRLTYFSLRDRVVEEYRDYVQSFVRVLDDRIDDFISSRLGEGELWPAAELQLNPAFKMDRTLGELGGARNHQAGNGPFLRRRAAALSAPARGHRHRLARRVLRGDDWHRIRQESHLPRALSSTRSSATSRTDTRFAHC